MTFIMVNKWNVSCMLIFNIVANNIITRTFFVVVHMSRDVRGGKGENMVRMG